jgi:hypothetical protein
MARTFNLEGPPGNFSLVGGSATAVVITYPEALLTKAKELIATGDFSIAVVVAHMACEISAERAISRAFAEKGIGYLGESVEDLLPGYNLANGRVRKLYNAVTGNEIQNQSFWQAFKDSATRRNQAVHRGMIITKTDAEASYNIQCGQRCSRIFKVERSSHRLARLGNARNIWRRWTFRPPPPCAEG